MTLALFPSSTLSLTLTRIGFESLSLTLPCSNSFLYNNQYKPASVVWDCQIVKNNQRCVDTSVSACDAAVRLRTVLAVHHLEAKGIMWWSNETEKVYADARGRAKDGEAKTKAIPI